MRHPLQFFPGIRGEGLTSGLQIASNGLNVFFWFGASVLNSQGSSKGGVSALSVHEIYVFVFPPLHGFVFVGILQLSDWRYELSIFDHGFQSEVVNV